MTLQKQSNFLNSNLYALQYGTWVLLPHLNARITIRQVDKFHVSVGFTHCGLYERKQTQVNLRG